MTVFVVLLNITVLVTQRTILVMLLVPMTMLSGFNLLLHTSLELSLGVLFSSCMLLPRYKIFYIYIFSFFSFIFNHSFLLLYSICHLILRETVLLSVVLMKLTRMLKTLSMIYKVLHHHIRLLLRWLDVTHFIISGGNII